MSLFGAGKTAGLATEYGQIVFFGMVLILFTNIAYAILRAEGDDRRAMYVMGASSVLNIILDPLLIYTAGMGIAGAAWGVVISLVTVSGVLLYWFFKKGIPTSRFRIRHSPGINRRCGISLVSVCQQVSSSFLCRYMQSSSTACS